MSQKSQTGGISFLGVVDVKRTKLLEKRTFGGIATQKALIQAGRPSHTTLDETSPLYNHPNSGYIILLFYSAKLVPFSLSWFSPPGANSIPPTSKWVEIGNTFEGTSDKGRPSGPTPRYFPSLANPYECAAM